PLALIVALWPHTTEPGALALRQRLGSATAVLAGVVALHIPLVAHYASHGQTAALWDGYVINRWGLEYAAFGTETMGRQAVREGLLALAYFLALPLSLALFSAQAPRGAPARTRTIVVVLWVWFAGALVAASIGF